MAWKMAHQGNVNEIYFRIEFTPQKTNPTRLLTVVSYGGTKLIATSIHDQITMYGAHDYFFFN